ncbi:MAG: AAA family ATPase [Cyclobacterium sp.]|uniref:AAA family ATPase n=1 Tax=Cyclobacterium sp. TaxID=1966343 RepID=UPI0039706745
MIIEVKDYHLDSYELDERRNWKVKGQSFNIKSPLNQVVQYKENLFDLHIESLLEMKIKDFKSFSMVRCAVYFHNATKEQLNNFLVIPFKENVKYQTWLKYNVELLGGDNLNQYDFQALLKKTYLVSKYPSLYFKKEIYRSFKRFLKPPIHLQEEGQDIPYSTKQLRIIHSKTKQQRIKGVVGSGKTTVMAARAVQAFKKYNHPVLLLSFNITLKNYIKDKISKVREEFPWDCFLINNYHEFINSQLNNLGIPFEIPEDFDQKNAQERSEYFESNFYSNKALFLENQNQIKRFSAILIDEIQDYKLPWMRILKECFLEPDGEYVLFGDVKQNLYNNEIEKKDVKANVSSVIELENCFRSDFKIKDLAVQFQKDIFQYKYEVDSFNTKEASLEIEYSGPQQGSIQYMFLPVADSVTSLYNIIHTNAINKDVPPNDITILGTSIELLKKFDAYYRYASGEKTNTMFESIELVYRMGLNRYKERDFPDWLVEGLELLKRNNDKNKSRGLNQISVLLTIHQLQEEYGRLFDPKLEFYCQRYNINLADFQGYIDKFHFEINTFKDDFSSMRQGRALEKVRKNKKIHFFMNSGTVKVSTVHSFKGWESDTLFLILEEKYSMTFDEILYVGITRSRSNLVLINFGNEEYHSKLEELVKKVN